MISTFNYNMYQINFLHIRSVSSEGVISHFPIRASAEMVSKIHRGRGDYT